MLTPIVESTYFNMDMCKFESPQKEESRARSADSSKAYTKLSAFECHCFVMNLVLGQYRVVKSMFFVSSMI